jgi:hypothetical protein
VIGNNGEEGTVFSLYEADVPVAAFEVYTNTVVVVHSSYSLLGVQAGEVPASTRVVLSRADHKRRLLQLRSELARDNDLGYAPTNEVLVGNGLESVTMRGTLKERRLWQDTKRCLRDMNPVVADCIQHQNCLEATRVGLKSSEIDQPRLSDFFN